jgi:hypothetical protein
MGVCGKLGNPCNQFILLVAGDCNALNALCLPFHVPLAHAEARIDRKQA